MSETEFKPAPKVLSAAEKAIAELAAKLGITKAAAAQQIADARVKEKPAKL